VILDPGGRHLLVEEAPDGTRVLNQPAGHLEAGESLLGAVVREVREETCREFSPEALLGVYRWQIPPDGDTYLRFCFVGEVGEERGELVRDPDILDTHWLAPEDLERTRLTLRSPMVRRCMQDALTGRRHPLELLCDLVPGHVRQ
jgi:8-oxo-dGTP pyrophosphatase MutT (NUDIX family)